MKKYLFVCRANRNRSPTAQGICNAMAKEKGLAIVADSAGYDADDDGNELSDFLLETSDKIFLMTENMREIIKKNYPIEVSDEKIVVLDIPDYYTRNQPELREILMEKLEKYMI